MNEVCKKCGCSSNHKLYSEQWYCAQTGEGIFFIHDKFDPVDVIYFYDGAYSDATSQLYKMLYARCPQYKKLLLLAKMRYV